jgi:hypothetical protein
MVESHYQGRPPDLPGVELEYGKSITDACIGWEDSPPCFDVRAEAVRQRAARRARVPPPAGPPRLRWRPAGCFDARLPRATIRRDGPHKACRCRCLGRSAESLPAAVLWRLPVAQRPLHFVR